MTTAPKAVLVTGAGGGIGSAVARRFATAGWRVLLTDVNEAALERVSRSLGDAAYRVADLTLRASCVETAAWAESVHARLDGLVNAAGIWREGPTEACSEEDFDAVFGVNVRGLYFMSSAAIPALRRTGGFIVNASLG